MGEKNQPNAQTVIEVCALGKHFGGVVALDNVDFTAQRGEILGILGPNGAGKTTTIHLLLGLITPTQGRINILGRNLRHNRREILGRVNFSSAYVSLPSNLSVRENLHVFARLYGIKNTAPKIEYLLEAFEIPETAGRLTGSLSAGQLTRLNLCKAFLNDPEILFLDEPTASLDPDIAAKVRDRLHALQQERQVTMIYTSHNMREVELMCNRLIFLAKGKIVMTGTPDKVLAQANSASLEDLFIAIARNGHLYEKPTPLEKPPCGSG